MPNSLLPLKIKIKILTAESQILSKAIWDLGPNHSVRRVARRNLKLGSYVSAHDLSQHYRKPLNDDQARRLNYLAQPATLYQIELAIHLRAQRAALGLEARWHQIAYAILRGRARSKVEKGWGKVGWRFFNKGINHERVVGILLQYHSPLHTATTKRLVEKLYKEWLDNPDFPVAIAA